MSGALGVRGGFDSHAFPPILAAVALTAAVCTSTPVAAQPFDPMPVAQDTVKKTTPPRPSTPPDTLMRPTDPVTPGRAELPAGGASADTGATGIVLVPREGETRRRISESDPRNLPRFDRPRWVMMRSLVVPGWGQFHNKAWIKGVAVAAGEVLLITRIVDDERTLTDLNEEVEVLRDAYNQTPNEETEAAFGQAVEDYNDLLEASTARRWWLGGLLAFSLIDAYIDAHFIDFDYQFEHDRALPEGKPATGTAKLRVGFRF